MCAVQLLEALLASCVEVGAVDGNYVVAAVGGGVEDRLVLAHKGQSDGGGDAPEGSWVSADVDEMPRTGIRKARLHH